MATGGERKAVWRFTAMRVANHSMSIFIAEMIGCMRGTKTRMIAGQSNGQPSRKMTTMIKASIATDGISQDRSALVATVAVPNLENTAPNTLPATARKMTVLDCSRVL